MSRDHTDCMVNDGSCGEVSVETRMLDLDVSIAARNQLTSSLLLVGVVCDENLSCYGQMVAAYGLHR